MRMRDRFLSPDASQQAVALHLEGYKTYSEVERAVMTRYFFFHLANVYVTLGAPSLDNVSTRSPSAELACLRVRAS